MDSSGTIAAWQRLAKTVVSLRKATMSAYLSDWLIVTNSERLSGRHRTEAIGVKTDCSVTAEPPATSQ